MYRYQAVLSRKISIFPASNSSSYMRRLFAILFLLLSSVVTVWAQQRFWGVVADAETRDILPFATIKYGEPVQGMVTDINGRFDLQTYAERIVVSYIGFTPLKLTSAQGDTIFLKPVANVVDEIVIKPPYEKIRGIVNRAIAAKDRHNPDKYDWYTCNVYYKMKADLQPSEAFYKNDEDTAGFKKFADRNHLFFSETYNKRIYRKPQQVQDVVIASRFSGLKKTYFTNLITGVIPFHIYEDRISLIGNNYLHPIAKGWQGRYEFDIVDELYRDGDTTYILKYRPKKGAAFNALRGMVYINTDGYAISHFTAGAEDTSAGRHVQIEQIYTKVADRWFPRELNYEFVFSKYPSPDMGVSAVGHSVIDSVSFAEIPGFKFDKGKSVVLTDSVDNHSEEDWQRYRSEDITVKERNTYHVIDSFSDKAGVNKLMDRLGNISTGRFPIGNLDLDFKRLLSVNNYENVRLGLGLYTNDGISKYWTLGGWFGYGFKDKEWKYGGSFRFYPKADKNNWLEASYEKNYRSTGSVFIHPYLDRNSFRNFLLQQVDFVEDLKLTYHDRFGYYETELYARYQSLTPQYAYSFDTFGTNTTFDIKEGGLSLRYAFGEKRTPVFGQYQPLGTKYPVVYLSLSVGEATTTTYKAGFGRALAAVSYNVHINRWGKDNFLFVGGIIETDNDLAVPRPLLLAANGYRFVNRLQLYQIGGFITMFPYQYFNDRFVSLYYKHDFDKCFYQTEFSKPYLSIAHNVMYGTLSDKNAKASPGTVGSGLYNESGIVLNHLLRFDYLHIGYIGFNVGAFYNWNSAPFDAEKYGRLALGISFNF